MLSHLRIYNDAEGESHVADGQWPMHDGDFTPPSPPGYLVSDTMEARGWMLMHHPPGYRDAWHTAPARLVVIVLAGSARVRTSDGSERIIRPGDRVLVEDVTGRGHKMEGVDGQAFSLALVLLEARPHEDPTP